MQRKIHKHPQKSTRYFLSPYRRKYVGRTDSDLGGGSLMSHPYKMLCVTCRKANRRMWALDACPVCGTDLIAIMPRVRLPRREASKREWDIFIKRFATHPKRHDFHEWRCECGIPNVSYARNCSDCGKERPSRTLKYMQTEQFL